MFSYKGGVAITLNVGKFLTHYSNVKNSNGKANGAQDDSPLNIGSTKLFQTLRYSFNQNALIVVAISVLSRFTIFIFKF